MDALTEDQGWDPYTAMNSEAATAIFSDPEIGAAIDDMAYDDAAAGDRIPMSWNELMPTTIGRRSPVAVAVWAGRLARDFVHDRLQVRVVGALPVHPPTVGALPEVLVQRPSPGQESIRDLLPLNDHQCAVADQTPREGIHPPREVEPIGNLDHLHPRVRSLSRSTRG